MINSDDKSKTEEIGLPKCNKFLLIKFRSHFKQFYKRNPYLTKHEERKTNF